MKKNPILVLLIGFSIHLFGQEVTETIARQVANGYYEKVQYDNTQDYVQTVKAALATRADRFPERVSPMGKAEMWLVPVPDGWVLVSTNMKTPPILAHYQTIQKPVFDNIPPAAKVFFTCYEKAITFANDSCLNGIINQKWARLQQFGNDNSSESTRSTEIISPLITTQWGQTGGGSCESEKYYNKYCPPTNKPYANHCNKSPVGCTAVAMAQIMNYWQWPFAAQVPTTPGGSTKELHFYDWAKTPYSINNGTPMDEVDMTAGLLRDCGYMANMHYADSGSTTIDIFAEQSFKSCGFDESLDLKRKLVTPGWRALLLSDLGNGRPVYYSAGNDKLEGHVFIVDGYNSDDLYHINFGWLGSQDGYYQIDTIAIPSLNVTKVIDYIVGEDTTYTYHTDTTYEYFHVYQGAIFGIQPAPNCGALTISNKTVSADFMYASEGELTLSNVTFQNVTRGEATSAMQVRLLPGTSVLSGSKVWFGIKEVPCVSTPSFSPSLLRETDAEQNEYISNDIRNIKKMSIITLSVFPNPVADYLTISSSEPIAQTMFFNLSGQLVLQTAEKEVDVSNLSPGAYIVRALLVNGETRQTKIVHL